MKKTLFIFTLLFTIITLSLPHAAHALITVDPREELATTAQEHFAKNSYHPTSSFAKEINELLLRRELLKQKTRALGTSNVDKMLFELEKENSLNAMERTGLSRKLLEVFIHYICFITRTDMELNKEQLVFLNDKNAPKLYGCVQTFCKELDIPTPLVVLADDETMVNAFAISFSHQFATILISKNYALQFPEDELKVIIGHELGHIKRNHDPKTTGLRALGSIGIPVALQIMTQLAIHFCSPLYSPLFNNDETHKKVKTGAHVATFLAGIASLIPATHLTRKYVTPIARQHEHEADEIAVRLTKNPKLIRSFLDCVYSVWYKYAKTQNEDDYDECYTPQDEAYNIFLQCDEMEKTFGNNNEAKNAFGEKVLGNQNPTLWQRIRGFFALGPVHPTNAERIKHVGG